MTRPATDHRAGAAPAPQPRATTAVRRPTADEVAELYLALGRVSRAVRRDAPDSPVGHGALSALATLAAGGPMRLGELSEAEGISAPSTTRIMALLEQLDLARRTPDPADRRASLVTATKAGRALLGRGRAARMTALRRRFDDLASEDQQVLLAAVGPLQALAALPRERPSADAG